MVFSISLCICLRAKSVRFAGDLTLAPRSNHSCCYSVAAPSSDNDITERSIWWMLLSHHPPCDLDRTWKLLGVDVCVRCLGMVLLFVATLVLAIAFRVPCTPLAVALCISAILPAGCDFTFEELVLSYPSSNWLRFSTGCIFGLGAGCIVSWVVTEGNWLPAVIFVVSALIMQLIIAFVFRVCGHLDSYIMKYEEAVRR